MNSWGTENGQGDAIRHTSC